jgi:NADH-quinone oxidoreductase subunit N
LNLNLIAPEITVVATALLVVLLDLVVRRKAVLAAVGITGLLVAIGFTIYIWTLPVAATGIAIFGRALVIDSFALFFKVLLLGIAALVILMSQDYISKLERFRGEYYALLLVATVGLMLMAATADLIVIYVSLELASITLYALTGFLKGKHSSEAALKYLLVGSIASATFLYGMALVFSVTGSTHLYDILAAIYAAVMGGSFINLAVIVGVILMIAGFGFKIAAVPFHMWVPDVYEGAPTTVTAYLSVASKAAGFAMIMRIFQTAFPIMSYDWGMIFAGLSVVTMTAGNLVALHQTNIKRLFGYSSIAQAGYIMVGVAALGMSGGQFGQSGVLFFLAAYALTNMGAFIAIVAITNKVKSDSIADFTGMIKRAPLLTVGFSLCLISLIGMPPAGGFLAKFYIFGEAIQSGLLWLVIVAVINSVISAVYYLKVVKVMWLGEPESVDKVSSSIALRVAMIIACAGVLFLGILPDAVMEIAKTTVSIFMNF